MLKSVFVVASVLRRRRLLLASLFAQIAVVALLLSTTSPQASAATASGWPTYLHDNARSGFNSAETIINVSSAPRLKLVWSYLSGDSVSTQPVVVNGLSYWGSWDGYERAIVPSGPTAGQVRWATFLGRTFPSGCPNPYPIGVVSTPTFVPSVSINGASHNVLYLGGGGNWDANNAVVPAPQATFNALDADTGALLWSTPLGIAPDNTIWSSPAYYNGSLYVGVASFGDCPLVTGKFVKIDASTGVTQSVLDIVPAGCTGGGVWGSPTVDESAGTIYINTGTPGGCVNQPYAEAVVELRSADLHVLGSWTIPSNSRVSDGDFGSAATLFTAKIKGSVQGMVGVANKNGSYYAFLRDRISAGPVWRKVIDQGGNCPQCGQGVIAPSAWDGSTLYVAGGQTTINGVSCAGSVQALNPANGSAKWRSCLPTTVLGAITAAPGILVVGEYSNAGGNRLLVMDSSRGNTLFSYASVGGENYFGAASIDNGVLYVGNVNGWMYAFAP